MGTFSWIIQMDSSTVILLLISWKQGVKVREGNMMVEWRSV